MMSQMSTRLQVLLGFLLVILALSPAVLAGCGRSPSATPSVTTHSPTPTRDSTTPTSATPVPAPSPLGPAPSFITLTIWGPEQFAPGESDAGAQVLQAQYQEFTSENPDLGVEYVTKAPYGEGGVLDFLLAASYAAPNVLPDVAIVDAFELGPLARAGIATPLQELVSEQLVADLFPFAQEACTFGDDLIALQFEADIEHAIYYTRTLETPPATWADLFVSPISYTFPAGGENGLVNDAFLIQYLAQESQLLDQEGKAALEHSPVQRVLRLYDAVRKYDVSPSEILEIHDLEECWAAYTEGNIALSHISSWRYLTSRAVLQDTSFAAVPTETGRTAAMSRGWAFVIITESPHRQEAAVRLIEWLMTSQNLAEWSVATNHLPARSAALPLTDWPQDYTQFLENQLQNAFYRPSTPEFDRIARALQVAAEDVLTGERTPREATSNLMESLE